MRDDPSSVTLEHVARAAGVSRATVSRALTGAGPVSAETQRHVSAVADVLGHVPDPVARELVRRQGTRVVATGLTSGTHPVEDVAAAAVRGALRRAQPAGTLFFPSELVVRESA